MERKMAALCSQEVPVNIEAQQDFLKKIETNLETGALLCRDLAHAAALSIIPEDIQKLQGQEVKQLQAMLQWFKNDLFTWMNKP